ncbi:hypothetical protein PDY_06030 [Photobacterium damselae subsp. damselae]|uniref:hypothetical protein n=1 Tax=Photobacterium damselae TaxID=38293 RepID=UPI0021FDBCF5|nr:hypothetical protein [Photobacterium damselae]BDR33555.1 hypothetical protein PDY_06030 [Photobacterium damselae subsp. damselae]
MKLTEAEIISILEAAHNAGSSAASQYIEQLSNEIKNGSIYGLGRASIVLDIDGRSKLAKCLMKIDLPYMKFGKNSSGYYSLKFKFNRELKDQITGQEDGIDDAGYRAALPILEQRFSIKGYVNNY